jgi:DNA-binding MarR family transcriptional regulator
MPGTATVVVDTVSEGLMPAVGAVRRLLRRLAGPSFTGDPLSTSQREVLVAVGRHPGSAVTEIADELGLAPNSVSTIVTQLVGAGMLVRETDPQDRRIGRLALTEQARGQVAEARRRRREVLHDALDRLSPQQVEALAAGLEALGVLADELKALEQEREAGGKG